MKITLKITKQCNNPFKVVQDLNPGDDASVDDDSEDDNKSDDLSESDQECPENNELDEREDRQTGNYSQL